MGNELNNVRRALDVAITRLDVRLASSHAYHLEEFAIDLGLRKQGYAVVKKTLLRESRRDA